MKPDERQRILRFWPALFSQGKLIDAHAGFSGAIVERLEIAGQHFALRGWPQDALPAARIIGLHHLQRFLYDRGINQVSVPVMTAEGQSMIQHENRFWQLEPWMPGEANFLEQPSDAKLKSVMQLLARLHLAAGQHVSSSDAAQWFSISHSASSPTIIERLLLVEQWSDTNPQTIRRLIDHKKIPETVKESLRQILTQFLPKVRMIQSELREMLTCESTLQPSLRDLWSDHVLFTDDRVTGLIDFGACRSENPMIDLSRLLGSYFIRDSDSYRKAINWYDEIRPVSSAERKLFPVFDHSQRILAGLTWIEWLIFEGKQPEDWKSVQERLDQIVPRMQAVQFELL